MLEGMEGVLDPDEEQQLKELLNYDESEIDDFLKEYFPKQYKQAAEKKARLDALASEEPEYPIVGEGDGWIEFHFKDRTIRLEREVRTGRPGRRRDNPYIDSREVNRLGASGRNACYAMAAYKLRKDGDETATYLDREISAMARKLLFRGEDGLESLMHLVRVSEQIIRKFDGYPVPKNLSVDTLVMQTLVANITKLLGKQLGGKS